MREFRARACIGALALLAAVLLAAAAASATTTGVDVDTALVDQAGTLRLVGSGALVDFDATCDATASKWMETRLMDLAWAQSGIGVLTSASLTGCTRPLTAATVLGLPTALGLPGTLLPVLYAGTDLATGELLLSVPGFSLETDAFGVQCLLTGTLAVHVRTTGRALLIDGILAGAGGLCPVRVRISGSLEDTPALQYTLLSGRR